MQVYNIPKLFDKVKYKIEVTDPTRDVQTASEDGSEVFATFLLVVIMLTTATGILIGDRPKTLRAFLRQNAKHSIENNATMTETTITCMNVIYLIMKIPGTDTTDPSHSHYGTEIPTQPSQISQTNDVLLGEQYLDIRKR
ncbi:hypothetical protein RF11_08908 [Thelohanellus kitauei]|uniref:Uncharacterized protein n=1 Tax=Thelohanellus kitauei TaxID=669202 RepID=A0A0C2NF52_THEKT|nr:hypothetical protein RF11_08908 [Thelohanellus kitauei]